jgi:hypothetical protein
VNFAMRARPQPENFLDDLSNSGLAVRRHSEGGNQPA